MSATKMVYEHERYAKSLEPALVIESEPTERSVSLYLAASHLPDGKTLLYMNTDMGLGQGGNMSIVLQPDDVAALAAYLCRVPDDHHEA